MTTDWERYTGDYLAHVEEAHEAEKSIALQRRDLDLYERQMVEIEDNLERATKEVDSGEPTPRIVSVIEGSNDAKRAAHKRLLCAADETWIDDDREARRLRQSIALRTADLHRAERLYRLAKLQLEALSGYKGGDS